MLIEHCGFCLKGIITQCQAGAEEKVFKSLGGKSSLALLLAKHRSSSNCIELDKIDIRHGACVKYHFSWIFWLRPGVNIIEIIIIFRQCYGAQLLKLATRWRIGSYC